MNSRYVETDDASLQYTDSFCGFDEFAEDDDDEFGCVCGECCEPCHKSKMSAHTPGVCRFCCPIHKADYAEDD